MAGANLPLLPIAALLLLFLLILLFLLDLACYRLRQRGSVQYFMLILPTLSLSQFSLLSTLLPQARPTCCVRKCVSAGSWEDAVRERCREGRPSPRQGEDGVDLGAVGLGEDALKHEQRDRSPHPHSS